MSKRPVGTALSLRLYRIKPSDGDFLTSMVTKMPEHLRHRLARYRQREDVWRSVAGVLLARKMLAEALGIAEAALPGFDYSNFGRPKLPETFGWRGDFNISHGGNLVVCAVNPKGRVGIDIETIAPVIPGVETYVLTPNESRCLTSLPSAERDAVFCRYWTLKESYLKALGTGLYVAPNQIAFRWRDGSNESELVRPRDGGESMGWRFSSQRVDSSVLSICSMVCADKP